MGRPNGWPRAPQTPAPDWLLAALIAIAGVACICGLVARFKSLGASPLAVDEYYVLRSVQNVLRSGLPQFQCGGWYERGLLLQYSVAALQLTGLPAIVALRLVAAVSSLLVLPAAFLIARRLYGPSVAFIAVAVLSISVWEIAMARFGRMYAPFQAIFLWYALFFLRFTLDAERKALGLMVLLSIAGILMWEGGVFLAGANLLALLGFQQRSRWSVRLALEVLGLLVLAVCAYWFIATGLPVSSGSADLPSVNAPPAFEYSRGLFDLAPAPLSFSAAHPGWLAAAFVPVAAVCAALPWVLRFRTRPLTLCGLLLALLAAACGQFAATLAVIALLLAFGRLEWSEIRNPAARRLHLALAAWLVYWLAFAVFVVDWHAVHAGSSSRLLALFAYEFTRVPDFTLVVLWPWARTIPELGLALSMLLVLTFVRVTRSGGMTAERAALALLLSMLVAASLSEPPRVETRYTFFLYPLALILSLGTLWRLVLTFGHDRRSAPALAAGIALGGFALTEDSSRNFLLHVERAETAGGAGGGDPNMAAHLVIRPDTPAMASWLTEHVARGRDIVISGYHSLDFYYPHINYFFVDWREDNFTQWACKGGALERWSNTPLLYTEAAIGSRIPPHAHAFLVVYADQRQRLVPDLARFGARVVWAGDAVSIIELNAS